MLPKTISFVDTETTGYSGSRDRIIEIAVIKTEDGVVVDEFQTLINPGGYIPPFIENYTGIKGSDLDCAPTFDSVAMRIFALLEGSVMVAHNANFDYGFLKNEFLRSGYNFEAERVCSVKLSRALYPTLRKYNLSNLIEVFGFECAHRHRAYDDAHVLYQLFQKFQTDFDQEDFTRAFQKCLKTQFLPPQIDESVIESLPSAPGVYIFYGEKGFPLYVGKSVDIRQRVKSHFYGESSVKERSLHDQVTNIDFVQTAGELSALILESKMVKELMPVFNRRLRRMQEMVVATKTLNDRGYFQVEFKRVKNLNKKNSKNMVGVFESVKSCKEKLYEIADKNNLCYKLLGLENALGACFRFHLGKCSGACACKESPQEYNARFEKAFNRKGSSLMEEWPFENQVKIIEDNGSGITESFTVDNWCVVDNNEMDGFDYDLYKIIKTYVLKGADSIKVIPL